MLRIRTLGGLSVQGGGRAPAGAATQPRRLAVLALVGRAGERGVTREKLLALLWPDADDESGRRALSQALYALRRDLDVDDVFLGVQELRLNPEAAACDVTEFEGALAERNLERAADLYDGPFLDGFRLPSAPEFDRWVDDERRALKQRYVELLERLARRVHDRGDPAGASVWWRKLADLDPLNARVAVELMRSLVAAGDAGGALKHARIYEALLAQELDLEPDRQVIELAQRIRKDAAAKSETSAANTRAGITTDAASGDLPNATPAPGTAIAAAVLTAAGSGGAAVATDAALTARISSTEPRRAAEPGRSVSAVSLGDPESSGASHAVARVVPQSPPAEAPRTSTPAATASAWTRQRLAAAVIAVVLLGSALAWWGGRGNRGADRQPVLAVGRIVDYRTADSREAEAVNDMLATNLARVNGLQVLSSARLYEVIAQVEDPRQPRTTIVARAAQRAGANELIEGGIHALADGRLLLDLRRVDLATGAVRNAYRLEGTDVYALVTQATEDLARGLDHPVGRLDPAEVSTRSLVAYRFYEEGLRSFGRADYRSAERLLDAAFAEDSGFAMALYYLVMARGELGIPQPRDIWQRLQRLAVRAPERERLLIRGAWAWAARRDELRAIADTLAERYPAEVDGPLLQGNARLQNAEFAAAIPYLQRVLAMDSLGLRGDSARCRACDAISPLLYAYIAIDSLGAAERLAREYVRWQPRSARAWLALADALAVQNRHEEALEAHRKATSINPVNIYDRVFAPGIHVRRGDFPEADRLTRSIIRDAPPPDANEARWLLAISLRYQGHWREALAVVREARAALSPAERAAGQEWPFMSLRALILLDSGQPWPAAAVWDSLAHGALPPEVAPGPPTARIRTFQFTLLTTALAATGDTSRLAAAVDSAAAWGAISTNRRDAYLLNHARGLMLVARADTAGAIAAFERAIFSPTAGFTRTNKELGALLLARGRARDAIRVVGAALRNGSLENTGLYVTHTELHELLARAHDATGAVDSARVHYRYVASALAGSDPGARPRYEAAQRWLTSHDRMR